jgi:hypothetical protein
MLSSVSGILTVPRIFVIERQAYERNDSVNLYVFNTENNYVKWTRVLRSSPRSLSCDRSLASSKASSPESAI